MIVRVINIEWDTDGLDIDLPDVMEIEVPENETFIEEYVGEELSNITGFCHFGFEIDE